MSNFIIPFALILIGGFDIVAAIGSQVPLVQKIFLIIVGLVFMLAAAASIVKNKRPPKE